MIAGDECASIPLNITVCGDVTVAIYHARQALTKTTGIKICQFQFHTNSLTPGRPSNVWNLPQLDQIIEPVRYADDFRVVLNCDTSEECSGKSLTWPAPQSKQLLFNSEQDYEATSRLATLPPNKFLDNNPGWILEFVMEILNLFLHFGFPFKCQVFSHIDFTTLNTGHTIWHWFHYMVITNNKI